MKQKYTAKNPKTQKISKKSIKAKQSDADAKARFMSKAFRDGSLPSKVLAKAYKDMAKSTKDISKLKSIYKKATEKK